MKKKIFILISVLILSALAALTFSACDLFKPTEIVIPEPPPVIVPDPSDDDPLKPPEVIPDHIHDYVWLITKKPTETETGNTAYCCFICKLVKEYKTLPTLDKWTKTHQDPTCEKFGRDTYTYFDKLQYSFYISIPMTEHAYGEWKISAEPAEGQGKARRVCTACNHGYEEKTLPALSEWSVTQDTATCEADGYITYSLSLDGDNYSFTKDAPAKGHDWGEWQEKEATCTDKGEKFRLCSRDSTHREKGEEIPILLHDVFKNFDDVSHWNECSLCGTTGEKVGHNYVNFVCKDCGFKALEANLIYALNSSDTYSVKGRIDDEITFIKVPEKYNGKPVTEIAEGAFAGIKISGISLPATLTNICENAFTNAEIEGIVDLTNSKITVEAGAFAYAAAGGFAFRTDTVIKDDAFLSVKFDEIGFEGDFNRWETFKDNLPRNCEGLKFPHTLKFIVKNSSGCMRHFCNSTDTPLCDDNKHWFVCANEDCNEIIFESEHTYNAGGRCTVCGYHKVEVAYIERKRSY